MEGKIYAYVENLFKDAPRNTGTLELKEEILSSLLDKYNYKIDSGIEEKIAFREVISNLGDVSELIREVNKEDITGLEDKIEAYKKKSAIRVSIAVGLYIISAAIIILFEAAGLNEEIGVVVMLGVIAMATGILIYNGMTKPSYIKDDEDTVVEEFKEWRSENSKDKALRKSIKSILWLIVVALYLGVSFTFGNWSYSWILFIIGSMVDTIIDLVFAMNNDDDISIKPIQSILWMFIVVIYFFSSFKLGNWSYSWIIFIIGAILNKIIELFFTLRKSK